MKRSTRPLIFFAFLAFISLGLPDGLFGVAAPSVRQTFSVGYDVMWMAALAGVLGYSTSGFFSGRLVAWMGVGKLLAASCALTGLTLLGNTLVPSWYWWVGISVFGGIGAGAIDSGLNTFMASHYGEHVMQWLHASYGVGVTLGPLMMTAALTWFNNWRLGYQWSGIGQLLLALAFLITVTMWADNTPASAAGEKKIHEYNTPIRETLAKPIAWMSMGLFFFYVGTEVSFGTWTYSILTESRGVDVATAGLWAGSYWATFTVGRIVAGFLTRLVGTNRLLNGGLLVGLAGAVLLWANPFPAASIIAVAVVGFAIAPIFPAFMSITAERVGQKHAANAIGLQIAATGLGGAALSGLAGILAQRTSLKLEVIPMLLVIQFVLLLGLQWATSRTPATIEA